MSKLPNDQDCVAHGEKVLDFLEEALRRSGSLLPNTVDQLRADASDVIGQGIAGAAKPDWYDDPFAALERGRYVIEHPPVIVLGAPDFAMVGNDLALAARNGKPITEEVRRAMAADRAKSESE